MVHKERWLLCILTTSVMSVLVTGGGLRWIRYCFINEQQAGTVPYRVVSICKAGAKKYVCVLVCVCEKIEWLEQRSEIERLKKSFRSGRQYCLVERCFRSDQSVPQATGFQCFALNLHLY